MIISQIFVNESYLEPYCHTVFGLDYLKLLKCESEEKWVKGLGSVKVGWKWDVYGSGRVGGEWRMGQIWNILDEYQGRI